MTQIIPRGVRWYRRERRDAAFAAQTPPPPGETSPTPEHPSQGRPTSLRTWAAIAWLAVLGTAAVAAGGYDAVMGTEINARLLGALVLAAGLVVLAGAVALRTDQPGARALAQIGTLLGVALGVMASLTQIANDEPDERLVVWGAIVVLSALAAGHVRVLTPREERSLGMWSRLPILKSAVSIGVLISIGQFWYSSIYLPTTAPASLSIDMQVDKARVRGQEVEVSGSVTVRNTSGTRVNVLASVLQLSGSSFVSIEPDDAEWRDRIRSADASGGTEIAVRHEEPAFTTRVMHQRLVAEAFYFEPDEVVRVPFLTRVPKGRYDTMTVDAMVTTAQARVLGLESATPEPAPKKKDPKRVVVVTKVPEAGKLQEFTRGPRYVSIEYLSDPDTPTFPSVTFTSKPGAGSDKGFDERLQNYYGVALTTAQSYISLR